MIMMPSVNAAAAGNAENNSDSMICLRLLIPGIQHKPAGGTTILAGGTGTMLLPAQHRCAAALLLLLPYHQLFSSSSSSAPVPVQQQASMTSWTLLWQVTGITGRDDVTHRLWRVVVTLLLDNGTATAAAARQQQQQGARSDAEHSSQYLGSKIRIRIRRYR
jgi:hypothetical protein